VIFGDEDILINNIAWILRRFAVFGAPGDGSYRMRPIFVDDMAKLAVDLARASDNVIVDAVGPETFTFDEWLRLLANTVGSRARILHLPPKLALWASRAISVLVRDVVLTSDEVKGLMADLLVTDGPPTGDTRLSDWLTDSADHVGRRYASEVARHYK
jgi:NADH dehydrogenase